MAWPPTPAEMQAHYLHMASLPGWREYAEHRVAQMAQRSPHLYAQLPGQVADVKIKTEKKHEEF